MLFTSDVSFLKLRTRDRNLGSGLSGWEVWNFFGHFGAFLLENIHAISFFIFLGLVQIFLRLLMRASLNKYLPTPPRSSALSIGCIPSVYLYLFPLDIRDWSFKRSGVEEKMASYLLRTVSHKNDDLLKISCA